MGGLPPSEGKGDKPIAGQVCWQTTRHGPGGPLENHPKDNIVKDDIVISRRFFFPSPHIPGKVAVGPYLPANVRAPNFFSRSRFLVRNYTNRRVPIHRYPVSVYAAWTWPFGKVSILDLAVAVGAPFSRVAGQSRRHPPNAGGSISRLGHRRLRTRWVSSRPPPWRSRNSLSGATRRDTARRKKNSRPFDFRIGGRRRRGGTPLMLAGHSAA